MKNALVITFSLFSAFLFAQDPMKQYDEIQIVGPGKIILLKGDTLNGILEYHPGSSEKVWFKTNEKVTKATLYKSGMVKLVSFDAGRIFESVPTLNMKGNPSDTVFYELLNNGNKYFKIYQSFSSDSKIVAGKLEGRTTLYASVPGKLSISILGNLNGKPFNEKFSEAVSDCPALSEKIKNEEKGYKMPKLTNDVARLKILNTIAIEYSNCH